MKKRLPTPTQSAALADKDGRPTTHSYRWMDSVGAAVTDTQDNLEAKDTFIASGAHGAVLYKAASDWAWLSPGTSGQILQSNGASANPSWVNAGASELASSTVSGTATNIILSGTWDVFELELLLFDLSHNAGGNPLLRIELSDDNGSTSKTIEGSYIRNLDGTLSGNKENATAFIISAPIDQTAQHLCGVVKIYRANVASAPKLVDAQTSFFNGGTEGQHITQGRVNMSAVNHIKLTWSSGSFDAGTVILRGKR